MTDLRKAAEMALKFCEDIGDLGGPYPYVNETAIVSDSRKVLQALRQALSQPVDAVNISQERVDKTAKREHEWKGLDGEIPGLGLVTEEFYNGMLVAEDILREKNGG